MHFVDGQQSGVEDGIRRDHSGPEIGACRHHPKGVRGRIHRETGDRSVAPMDAYAVAPATMRTTRDPNMQARVRHCPHAERRESRGAGERSAGADRRHDIRVGVVGGVPTPTDAFDSPGSSMPLESIRGDPSVDQCLRACYAAEHPDRRRYLAVHAPQTATEPTRSEGVFGAAVDVRPDRPRGRMLEEGVRPRFVDEPARAWNYAAWGRSDASAILRPQLR